MHSLTVPVVAAAVPATDPDRIGFFLKPVFQRNLVPTQKSPIQKSNDRLRLTDIKIFPRIGVTSEERAMPQECRADLEIRMNLANAAATDDLEHAIDYGLVLDTMRATATAREYVLLETLAYALLECVRADFQVDGAMVRVRKRPVSLREKFDFVEVEVERGFGND